MTSEQPLTVDVLRSAIEVLLKTANGPTPHDPFLRAQWEMSGAHAMMATGVLSLYQMISHHHHFEETIYYPMFRAEFDTASIVAEHKQVHDGIADVEDYLTSCLYIGDTWGYGQVVTASAKRVVEDPVPFDGRRLRGLIDNFVMSLVQHLQSEIIYMEPATIRKSGMTDAEMIAINKATTKHFVRKPKTTLLVYATLHAPPTSGFPPAPRFVKSFLVPYVFYGFHRQWWKFAPRKK